MGRTEDRTTRISDTVAAAGRPHASKPLAHGRATLPDGSVSLVLVHEVGPTYLDLSVLAGDTLEVGDTLVMSIPVPGHGAALVRGRVSQRQQLRPGGPIEARAQLVLNPDGRWLLTALQQGAA